MLRIPQSVYDSIVEHALADSPIEACGYLSGREGDAKTSYRLKNTDASGEHFSFDPEEQFAAFKDAMSLGLKLIACYHSHPQTPARPSAEDIKLAYDPAISYVIISLAEDVPVVKSFKIKNGDVSPEEIEVL
ncbi:MAG: M67 family metallopeptidase [Spirochaetia bacterium]|jgi:proteasome lid subunit RPN8/RPN11|nr:M67 family metallopeptidase [Spirochaetia bacterium]